MVRTNRVSTLFLTLLSLTPATVFSQTIVTSFAPPGNTDPLVWYENDIRVGGVADIVSLEGLGGDLESSQPYPIGAALLTTDMTNAAKAEVGVNDDYGMPASTFGSLSLSYSYFKADNPGQNLNSAPSLKIAFLNPVCDDRSGEARSYPFGIDGSACSYCCRFRGMESDAAI